MLDSRPLLIATDFPAVRRGHLEILQVNLGYLCNLSCVHCHVNAGPKRKELMDRQTIDLVLDYIDRHAIKTLDLTGGAPEMNPHFRYLVDEARARDMAVIDRCNLTILMLPEYADLAAFLASRQLIVTASLPCYSEQNVEKQRGKGVFHDSIEALKKLNQLGYGREPGLELNLVYNPVGASLPPPQQQLEQDYKRELRDTYGIEFNHLLTLTNMPVSRFGRVLMAKGQFNSYMGLLKDNFSEPNLQTLMCKTLISVDWQGYVYDCDFNQMLGMDMLHNAASAPRHTHLSDLLTENLEGDYIHIGDHCYGCTAGQGSSCAGALS